MTPHAEVLTFYPMATAPLDGTTVLLELAEGVVGAGYWDPTFSGANLGEEFGFAEIGAWTDGSMASVTYQEYNSFDEPLRWAPLPIVQVGALATSQTGWPARSGWLSREQLPAEMAGETLIRAYAPATAAPAGSGTYYTPPRVSVADFRAQPLSYSHWLPLSHLS